MGNNISKMIWKLNDAMMERKYEKLGAIVSYPNGQTGLDIKKVAIHDRKVNRIFTAISVVGTVGAVVLGNKLGEMNS